MQQWQWHTVMVVSIRVAESCGLVGIESGGDRCGICAAVLGSRAPITYNITEEFNIWYGQVMDYAS
jgi:hypothetical protein